MWSGDRGARRTTQGPTYADKQIHGQRELRLNKPGLLGNISGRGYGQNEHKVDFNWGYKWQFYKEVRQRFKYKARDFSIGLQETIKLFRFYYEQAVVNRFLKPIFLKDTLAKKSLFCSAQTQHTDMIGDMSAKPRKLSDIKQKPCGHVDIWHSLLKFDVIFPFTKLKKHNLKKIAHILGCLIKLIEIK